MVLHGDSLSTDHYPLQEPFRAQISPFSVGPRSSTSSLFRSFMEDNPESMTKKKKDMKFEE